MINIPLRLMFVAIIMSALLFSFEEYNPAARRGIIPLGKRQVLGPERPFLQGHASTIAKAEGDKYIVAWFGGTHEKHDDVGIWLSKGNAKGWTAPVEVAKIREEPHWNPVLFKTPTGEIVLFFKVGKTIDEWETWVMRSSDNGTTWSKPEELVKGDRGGRGPVRNKPIILSDGTWLAGASNETKGVWNAFVDRSEDAGKSWKASNYLSLNRKEILNEGIIQPTLWESTSGHVHMLLRSSTGSICRSDSDDYGKTWTPVYKTSLPNPNSGIDVTRISGNVLALVFNPDNQNWGERKQLSIAISRDNGLTWTTAIDIEAGVPGDEFSYPAIISMHDTIAVSYTWKRQNITFWSGVVR